MAYSYKQKNKSIQTKGTLQSVERTGPHKEWVGMPDYYIFMLTVDDHIYSYLLPEKQLPMEQGSYVCFRYRSTAKGNFIDKHSLGIAIDPTEYMQQMEQDS